MAYSVEPLPGEPEQKKDPDRPTPLVRLTEYGKVATLFLALVSPVHDLPFGVLDHKPHTENKEPSNRVNSFQVANVTTYAKVSTNIVSFGNWRTPGSST